MTLISMKCARVLRLHQTNSDNRLVRGIIKDMVTCCDLCLRVTLTNYNLSFEFAKINFVTAIISNCR